MPATNTPWPPSHKSDQLALKRLPQLGCRHLNAVDALTRWILCGDSAPEHTILDIQTKHPPPPFAVVAVESLLSPTFGVQRWCFPRFPWPGMSSAHHLNMFPGLHSKHSPHLFLGLNRFSQQDEFVSHLLSVRYADARSKTPSLRPFMAHPFSPLNATDPSLVDGRRTRTDPLEPARARTNSAG